MTTRNPYRTCRIPSQTPGIGQRKEQSRHRTALLPGALSRAVKRFSLFIYFDVNACQTEPTLVPCFPVSLCLPLLQPTPHAVAALCQGV